FPETLEALDLHAATPDLDDGVEDFGDAENGMHPGMLALALDDLKERLVLVFEGLHADSFLREGGDELGDGAGFVDLDETTASARALVAGRGGDLDRFGRGLAFLPDGGFAVREGEGLGIFLGALAS